MSETRLLGEEARKAHRLRLDNGFIDAYLSGAHILDIGYKGYIEDVVPIVPQAIGVELDYPGYDGRTLPFADGSQDAVVSSHCLEHIADTVQALTDWFRVLKIGGFLVAMVPHQFLYEKRSALPSRYNADHKRYYTPASLMADIEAALLPNSYRLRHLADNDHTFDYAIPPERHSTGCYEIELVLEKIATPDWKIDTRDNPRQVGQPANTLIEALRTRVDSAIVSRARVLPGSPWDIALYDFGAGAQIGKAAQTAGHRILALQLGHLGDFVIGLPALRELRTLFPDSTLCLVVGSWNRDAALSCGLVDEVATHDFFPQVARGWNGQPVEDEKALAAAAPGHFDIAVDLRVDGDTRHLLRHVDAGLRCGIGVPAQSPYLDIVLPYDQRLRRTDTWDRSLNVLLGPERFESRMPVQTPFRHTTRFRSVGLHVIYGPYLPLPRGSFRALFGLEMSGLRFGRGRTRITLDVAQGATAVLAERVFTADEIADGPGDGIYLDFTVEDDTDTCEFRVHIAGRPLRAALAFTGVRLERLAPPSIARLRPADLHIGEQLSLLVRLVSDRTKSLYPDASALVDDTGLQSPVAKPHIVIAPVSNSDLRDWPADHYATLIRLLVERLDCTVQLIGSRDQTGILSHVVQASGVGHRVTNLGGRTAWADIPDILRAADLVICNNSGIAHLAASIGARTLSVYSASHQPQEWGPRGQQSRALMAVLPCSPCGYDRLSECPHQHACMEGLPPETVFAQAASWLGRS